jgi:ABC-type uncharacterized transport system involved in gliding motility auxiliary subunit
MQKILTHKFGLFFILLAFAMLNFLASVFHSKLDLTKEKRFTISKATKTALKGLNEKVEITVFLEGSLPSGFQKLANTTNDF